MKKPKNKSTNLSKELHQQLGIPAYKTGKHESSEPAAFEKKEKRMKLEPEYKKKKK